MAVQIRKKANPRECGNTCAAVNFPEKGEIRKPCQAAANAIAVMGIRLIIWRRNCQSRVIMHRT